MKKLDTYIINEPNKLINYWKKEKTAVFWIVVSGIIYNVGMVLGPIFQGKLFDALNQKMSLTSIMYLSTAFIGSIIFVQIFRYIKRFYIRRFANSTSSTMRFMLYNNIVHKSEKQLNEENMGALMTKAIADVDACVEGMRKFTTEVFDTGVLLVTYLITMLIYDVKVTLISCIFIPMAMIIAEKLKTLIYKFTIAYRKKASKITDITYDIVENAMIYRLYGREYENQIKYEEELKDFEKKAVAANLWENAMQPIYNVIAMTGVFIVIGMGADKVFNKTWTIGVFTAYMSIYAAMAFKASKAAKLFNSVQKSHVSWGRLKPYMTKYQEVDNEIDTKSHAQSQSQSQRQSQTESQSKSQSQSITQLTINNLKCSYEEGEKAIINGICLKAAGGDFVGVTGPVACGKSTFGKIFLGEIPFQGTFEINGKNMLEYSQLNRCKIISYLGHNANLVSDTIYNNITLGDDGDINEVISLVCLDKDLQQMEDGINTLVGNAGIRLSGGQQSRIALARALYHKSEIIILDDPFSAVDKGTEERIIYNLKTFCKDCLVILISHRLHIFNQMDQIILMHKDKTYEYGTHNELLKTSSLYRELYQLQEKGGEMDED